jgi:hypothetical protein
MQIHIIGQFEQSKQPLMVWLQPLDLDVSLALG